MVRVEKTLFCLLRQLCLLPMPNYGFALRYVGRDSETIYMKSTSANCTFPTQTTWKVRAHACIHTRLRPHVHPVVITDVDKGHRLDFLLKERTCATSILFLHSPPNPWHSHQTTNALLFALSGSRQGPKSK